MRTCHMSSWHWECCDHSQQVLHMSCWCTFHCVKEGCQVLKGNKILGHHLPALFSWSVPARRIMGHHWTCMSHVSHHEFSCFMAITQAKHAQTLNDMQSCIASRPDNYAYSLLRLLLFMIFTLLIIFPPVSSCVLSLCTPNLDFERVGEHAQRMADERSF